jgi:gamma-glutamyl:cysteine ligase YbdK (ATP-grasp superfamily)
MTQPRRPVPVPLPSPEGVGAVHAETITPRYRGRLIGVESEFFVVHRTTLEPVDCLDALSAHPGFGTRIKREVVNEQIEIASSAFWTLPDLHEELRDLIADVMAIVHRRGAMLLPVALLEDDRLTWTSDPRVRELEHRLGKAFRRYAGSIAAEHINIGAADEVDAFRIFNRFRGFADVLVGLGAASPVLGGVENGVAANRLAIYDRSAGQQRVPPGLPPRLTSLADYAALLANSSVSGDPRSYYAYMRPMPHRGVAVEIRCIDKQPTLTDTMAVAALGRAVLGSTLEPPDDDEALTERFERARRMGSVGRVRGRAFLESLRPFLSMAEQPYLDHLARGLANGGPAHRLARLHRSHGADGAWRVLAQNLIDEVEA